ncbi:MAG: hypothetical protein SFW35_00790 [Chitinophagales bacterium]|nr:hypothetical protein [Chitinophagales bacterium]
MMLDIQQITIGQYLNYCHLIKEWQPTLEAQFPNKEDISYLEILNKCPEYIEAIVKFWTGWETIRDKDADMVFGLFVAIEKLNIIPEPVPLKAFELEGEWYHAPTDVQLLEKTVPMGNATFGQALEALQTEQLMQGNMDLVPHVLATIFLKEGETIDDVPLSERAASMRRLPLVKAMNAYFFLARSASTWLKRINRYLEATMMPEASVQA